ncbi:hypothetical protein CNEO4_1590024 [Clostridium neonatale]|uniref:Uncharacterized protein n=1 Tax=Clostridium neonatale TaxID=137838 RepID=A0AAD1YGQ2_9CLOT|nr:hypothetical protein CNEO2_380014 [Clostridium neonatale]CAI3207966.1 hypothetical protein CNEO2_400043 [Clostridium neonatale]CAI3238959.1 hypothetical protein CNEO2_300014 [Clostridium neonatale]CAI3239289.1 hypothetical protein CNEO2_320014 [Clostridium neonatale]CAI3579357.1 hypothetical protein CNEO4_1240001 [Clostridium neonatale]
MKDKKNICIIEDKYIVWNQNLVDNNRNPIPKNIVFYQL